MEEKEWFAADNAEYTYEMLKYSNGVGYKAIHQPRARWLEFYLRHFQGIPRKIWGAILAFRNRSFCWWLIWIPWQFFRSTVVQASRKG